MDIAEFLITQKPNYINVGDETDLFEAAFTNKIPVMLKGPTGWVKLGCGVYGLVS